MDNTDDCRQNGRARHRRVRITSYNVCYTKLLRDESNIEEGRISVSSPLGKAMLGKAPGEDVILQAPGGRRCYELVEIL